MELMILSIILGFAIYFIVSYIGKAFKKNDMCNGCDKKGSGCGLGKSKSNK